eukprot:Pgem_evm1s8186
MFGIVVNSASISVEKSNSINIDDINVLQTSTTTSTIESTSTATIMDSTTTTTTMQDDAQTWEQFGKDQKAMWENTGLQYAKTGSALGSGFANAGS